MTSRETYLHRFLCFRRSYLDSLHKDNIKSS